MGKEMSEYKRWRIDYRRKKRKDALLRFRIKKTEIMISFWKLVLRILQKVFAAFGLEER